MGRNSINIESKNIFKARWKIFKSNKRAFYSLIIFSVIFVVTLFAEFIANDKPILIYKDNKLFLPMFEFVSEVDLGGDFLSEPDFNDEFVKNLLKDSFVIYPLIHYSYKSIILDLKTPAPTPPDLKHLLGSDDLARDVLARLIYGLRISIIFGLVLSFFSVILGVAIGAFQGYYGGLVDLIGQRVIEIYSSVPILFLLIILSSFINPSFFWILVIVLAFSWIGLASIVRAEFLKAKNMDFVKAALALGLSPFKIMFKHILPNAMVATITYIPFIMVGSITTLVTLDFIGFGLPPGSASLGELLEQAKNNLTSPHLALSGFLSVVIILSVLVFIGEGLKEALDSKHNLEN